MGYSFAAGTTDGPGSFAFEQGTTTSNPMWNAVRNFVAAPTDEDIKCHAAKPILLATGRVSKMSNNLNVTSLFIIYLLISIGITIIFLIVTCVLFHVNNMYS